MTRTMRIFWLQTFMSFSVQLWEGFFPAQHTSHIPWLSFKMKLESLVYENTIATLLSICCQCCKLSCFAQCSYERFFLSNTTCLAYTFAWMQYEAGKSRVWKHCRNIVINLLSIHFIMHICIASLHISFLSIWFFWIPSTPPFLPTNNDITTSLASTAFDDLACYDTVNTDHMMIINPHDNHSTSKS